MTWTSSSCWLATLPPPLAPLSPRIWTRQAGRLQWHPAPQQVGLQAGTCLPDQHAELPDPLVHVQVWGYQHCVDRWPSPSPQVPRAARLPRGPRRSQPSHCSRDASAVGQRQLLLSMRRCESLACMGWSCQPRQKLLPGLCRSSSRGVGCPGPSTGCACRPPLQLHLLGIGQPPGCQA